MWSEEHRGGARNPASAARAIATTSWRCSGARIVRETERSFRGYDVTSAAPRAAERLRGDGIGRSRSSARAPPHAQCERPIGCEQIASASGRCSGLGDEIAARCAGFRARIGDDDHLVGPARESMRNSPEKLSFASSHRRSPDRRWASQLECARCRAPARHRLRSSRPEIRVAPAIAAAAATSKGSSRPLGRSGDDHVGTPASLAHRGGHDHASTDTRPAPSRQPLRWQSLRSQRPDDAGRRAAYPSTVIMTAAVARLAGVRK